MSQCHNVCLARHYLWQLQHFHVFTYNNLARRTRTIHITLQVTWLASPRSEAQALVCLPVRGAPRWVLLQRSIMWVLSYFSSSSVASSTFSVLSVYSKFGHHPHPLGYLCATFCFFRDLGCWARPWRNTAYSINHSPSLFDATGTEAIAIWKRIAIV